MNTRLAFLTTLGGAAVVAGSGGAFAGPTMIRNRSFRGVLPFERIAGLPTLAEAQMRLRYLKAMPFPEVMRHAGVSSIIKTDNSIIEAFQNCNDNCPTDSPTSDPTLREIGWVVAEQAPMQNIQEYSGFAGPGQMLQFRAVGGATYKFVNNIKIAACKASYSVTAGVVGVMAALIVNQSSNYSAQIVNVARLFLDTEITFDEFWAAVSLFLVPEVLVPLVVAAGGTVAALAFSAYCVGQGIT